MIRLKHTFLQWLSRRSYPLVVILLGSILIGVSLSGLFVGIYSLLYHIAPTVRWLASGILLGALAGIHIGIMVVVIFSYRDETLLPWQPRLSSLTRSLVFGLLLLCGLCPILLSW